MSLHGVPVVVQGSGPTSLMMAASLSSPPLRCTWRCLLPWRPPLAFITTDMCGHLNKLPAPTIWVDLWRRPRPRSSWVCRAWYWRVLLRLHYTTTPITLGKQCLDLPLRHLRPVSLQWDFVGEDSIERCPSNSHTLLFVMKVDPKLITLLGSSKLFRPRWWPAWLRRTTVLTGCHFHLVSKTDLIINIETCGNFLVIFHWGKHIPVGHFGRPYEAIIGTKSDPATWVVARWSKTLMSDCQLCQWSRPATGHWASSWWCTGPVPWPSLILTNGQLEVVQLSIMLQPWWM